IAIVTDVTHDTTTPLINKNIEGDVLCGKGPSLSYAPAVHNKLLALVEKVATDKKIDVQWRALSRSTGTDTDSFAYSNDGCTSVPIFSNFLIRTYNFRITNQKITILR